MENKALDQCHLIEQLKYIQNDRERSEFKNVTPERKCVVNEMLFYRAINK